MLDVRAKDWRPPAEFFLCVNILGAIADSFSSSHSVSLRQYETAENIDIPLHCTPATTFDNGRNSHLEMIDSLQRIDARHASKLETQHDGFVVLTSVTHVLANQHKVRPESSAQEWENIYRYFIFVCTPNGQRAEENQKVQSQVFMSLEFCCWTALALRLIRDSIIVTPTHERTFVLVDLCLRQTRKFGKTKTNEERQEKERNSIWRAILKRIGEAVMGY